MALKTYRPTTPSRRNMTSLNFSDITKTKPEKSLVVIRKEHAGRNNQGRVTCRHRGSGVKQKIRIVDFKRDKTGIPGKVAAVEYDPNRSANLLLVYYVDGEKRYALAPVGIKVGDTLMAGEGADIRPGNALPLKNIPAGTSIHNIEINLGKGGQIVRSAGSSAQLMAKEGGFCLVRLPSGELRRVNENCMATIGQVSNPDHSNVNLGKSGRKRLMGWRPSVRGTAMTPREHPHGGGEGRCPVGMPGPKTPWGKPARGYKTRRNKRSNTFIVKRRN